MLVNVTQFEPDRAEVNYVIRSRPAATTTCAWSTGRRARRDADELLGEDGLHLSEQGREALADMIATALGRAPTGSTGTCLRPR